MRFFNFHLIAILLLLIGCQTVPKDGQTEADAALSEAQIIINKAIEVYGGSEYEHFKASFTFRGKLYRAQKNGGVYAYERIFTDSLGQYITDRLTNEGFERKVNSIPVMLNKEKIEAYSNSINSVMYFTFLPYFLNDDAVQKSFLGKVTIHDVPYNKIKVTFKQQGGGEDYEDEYIYWFHAEDYTLDYLAYNFLINGGGARFRQAFHRRVVGSLIFQDYYNFKPKTDTRNIATFDSLFMEDKLELLSKIENDNLIVTHQDIN